MLLVLMQGHYENSTHEAGIQQCFLHQVTARGHLMQPLEYTKEVNWLTRKRKCIL